MVSTPKQILFGWSSQDE